MKIEYLHASKFGNGATVAAYVKEQLASEGVDVTIHHIREVRPGELPAADLYVFSSPGRFGTPIRGLRRFLSRVALPPGTQYAILTTEAGPRPDGKTGQIPTEEELAKAEEELAKYQRVRPIMNEILQSKGLVSVAEDTVHVIGLKGPLEEGWQERVRAFLGRLPVSSGASGEERIGMQVHPTAA